MMPIAAAGHTGSGVEQTVIRFLLLSVGFAMVMTCLLTTGSCQSAAGGHRSSARSWASATDVST